VPPGVGMSKRRREETRSRIAETAGRYRQALDQADALIVAGYAEPDGDVTPGLGTALANPDDPLMLSAAEWALVLRIAHLADLGPAQQPREERS
jgi:hypothetical protein